MLFLHSVTPLVQSLQHQSSKLAQHLATNQAPQSYHLFRVNHLYRCKVSFTAGDMQVHGSCSPTHANEAVGFSRKALWSHFPVPAYNICGGSAQEPPSRPMAFHLASCQSMLLPCWLMQSLLVVHGCGNLNHSEIHRGTLQLSCRDG